MPSLIDITGQEMNGLRVIERDGVNHRGKAMWKVLCLRCGETKRMRGDRIKDSRNKACGCLMASTQLKPTHGMTGTRLYKTWSAMMERCYRVNAAQYAGYGGRGISVCNRWHDFTKFRDDMGDPPAGSSLDRIDTNGDYGPGNCRWATATEQQNNRRCNRFVTYRGKRMTIAQLAAMHGLPDSRVRARLGRGWTAEDAVHIEPIKGSRSP